MTKIGCTAIAAILLMATAQQYLPGDPAARAQQPRRCVGSNLRVAAKRLHLPPRANLRTNRHVCGRPSELGGYVPQ